MPINGQQWPLRAGNKSQFPGPPANARHTTASKTYAAYEDWASSRRAAKSWPTKELYVEKTISVGLGGCHWLGDPICEGGGSGAEDLYPQTWEANTGAAP